MGELERRETMDFNLRKEETELGALLLCIDAFRGAELSMRRRAEVNIPAFNSPQAEFSW
jgi:hypothetical protein